MNEQKAIELIRSVGLYTHHEGKMRELIALCQAAQRPAYLVQLTEAEILDCDCIGNNPSIYDVIKFGKSIIAAHIAKQGGAA